MKKVYKQYLSEGTVLLLVTVIVNICNIILKTYLSQVLIFEQFSIITLINTNGINQIIQVIFYASVLSLETIVIFHILEIQNRFKVNKQFVS